MTLAESPYLNRKLSALCVRCGQPASETSVLCEPHRADAARRVSLATRARRETRRLLGQCAICGAGSLSYRCGGCSAQLAAAR